MGGGGEGDDKVWTAVTFLSALHYQSPPSLPSPPTPQLRCTDLHPHSTASAFPSYPLDPLPSLVHPSPPVL